MGLDKAYDRIFQDIKQFPDPDQDLVEHTLKWIYAAPGLLQTEEILSAVRVRVKDDSLKFIQPVNKETLLSMCKNLLIVDSEDQWRFCHLSVREYLDNEVKSTETFSDTRSFCAIICFRTLLLSFDPEGKIFSQANLTEEKNLDRFENPFHPANPFSRHCQFYWAFYAKAKITNASHVPLLERFLGSPNEASSFYRCWFNYAVALSSEKYRNASTPFVSDYKTTLKRWPSPHAKLSTAPIFLVAYFALYEPLREWCENSDMSPFHSTANGEYLLTIAVQSKCEPFCTALIAKGRSFDKEFQLCLRQALLAAAYQGDIAMVQYLIENGADASGSPELKGAFSLYSSPVDAAARKGDLGLVRYLVEEAKANIGDALFWAAETESKETGRDIIRYLIESHRADPNLRPERHRYESALVVATRFCRRDMIKYYLKETNVDVNAVYKTGSYGSPLCAMIWSGSLEDVRYFVKEGKADVNLLHEFVGYGSALATAAFLGKLEIIKYLVEEAGANPDLQLKVGRCGNALTAALDSAESRGFETVKYLAPRTQVNLRLLHGNYGSALSAVFELSSSVSNANMDIVRLFIQA